MTALDVWEPLRLAILFIPPATPEQHEHAGNWRPLRYATAQVIACIVSRADSGGRCSVMSRDTVDMYLGTLFTSGVGFRGVSVLTPRADDFEPTAANWAFNQQ